MSAALSLDAWGAQATAPALAIAPGTFQPEIFRESIDCPCCGSHQFRTIIEATDPLTGIGGKFPIVECESCSMVITNPRPTLASLGYFYPAEYSPYDHNSGDGLKAFDRFIEQSALRTDFGYPPQPVGLLTRMASRLAASRFRTKFTRHEWIPWTGSGRLLDVGCGSGGFLTRMKRLGWNVEGIDYASDVARKVQERTGIRVLAGTIPHPELKLSSYDVVSLWHVLEHVPDPRATLSAAADLLAPGGKLVLEVPNIESWSFAEFREDWFALEAPRHLNHFSPKSLAKILPEGRFSSVKIEQIGMRSWIRKSAQMAVKKGHEKYNAWLKAGKPHFTKLAAQSEADHRGDALRLIAVKSNA
ncbi:Methyltransferase type 12 [Planctopirus limnophila DSM 3776]|uniref:Methyltransferase type 12 n=1 Tax=Planctopirus limnophila (strain ATCC 43296 / DSM 3776 / IFAM 1008 / Mu 290) TaxID=521674 RepID=D5SQP3_PLAL2|nr:class I SAM-dependent methyltransferase [Planctopirus limnophila]ADG68505.1 Methyltransferase type 12 [Planctopirus limnophila DSM 3776]